MESMFYALPEMDLRKLDYNIAIANNIKLKFNQSLGLAGKDWLKGLMKL